MLGLIRQAQDQKDGGDSPSKQQHSHGSPVKTVLATFQHKTNEPSIAHHGSQKVK